jgi:hypothetical protein
MTLRRVALTAIVFVCACGAAGEVVRFSAVPFLTPNGPTVSIVDSTHAWVGLVNTSDGGMSWSARVPDAVEPWRFSLSAPDQQLTNFATERRGWLSWRSVWQTEDAGATWIRLFDGHVRDLAFSTGGSGWMAVGGDGNFRSYVTDDSGKTWRSCGDEHPYSGGAPMGSASFVDRATGWTTFAKLNSRDLAIPPQGVARTTDGGCSWTPVWWNFQTMPYPMGDIVFVDDLTGWLTILNGGGLFRTRDGGKSWNHLPLPNADFNLGSAYPVDGTRGWVLGSWAEEPKENSGIYYTEDSGSHWVSLSSADLRSKTGLASRIPIAWTDGFAAKLLR